MKQFDSKKKEMEKDAVILINHPWIDETTYFNQTPRTFDNNKKKSPLDFYYYGGEAVTLLEWI